MELSLPEKVRHIIDTFAQAGFEAYAVGGCIRDSLLGREPEDWDVTTSAKPNEVKALFPKTIDTGIAHGTVTVCIGREAFEVTTYRLDGKYEDSRHPSEVTFTPSLLEDLKRRDFTINAMAYRPGEGLVDAFDGMGDLKKKKIRCVGEARQRFLEDALRMMRAARFAAQLGFAIDADTKSAICALAPTLKNISAERIREELVKLICSSHPETFLELYQTGMTGVVLPEFDAMMRTGQNTPHHCGTVGEHSIQAMGCVGQDKALRLTMLLHDVAKPACKTVGEDGLDHFYGHPKEGARMARAIMRRLKFDNDTIARVCRLVEGHDDNPPLSERAVRRAIVRIGAEAFPAMFDVKRADALAQSAFLRAEKLEYIRGYEELYRSILEKKQCLTLKELAVGGSDLIAAGFTAGPSLGDALKSLLEEVLEDPEKNTKEYLTAKAKELKRSAAQECPQ